MKLEKNNQNNKGKEHMMPNKNTGRNKRKIESIRVDTHQTRVKKTLNQATIEQTKYGQRQDKKALSEIMKEQTEYSNTKVEEYKTKLQENREKILEADVQKLEKEIETKNKMILQYMRVRETSEQVIQIHRELAIKQDELINCKDNRCQLQEKLIKNDKMLIDFLQEKFKEINNSSTNFLNQDA